MRLVIGVMLMFSSMYVSAGLLSEPDKQLHVKASIGAASFFYMINTYSGRSHWETAAECMAVGIGKEIYDEISYGGFDTRDLAADAVGCAIGVLLADSAWKIAASSTEVGISYEWKF